MQKTFLNDAKKTLVCDFDGTLIQGDSETFLINYLREKHYLDWKNYLLALVSIPTNRLCKFFGGHDIVRAWSAFNPYPKNEKLISDFLNDEQYIHFNQSVIELIESYDGNKLLLTGSNQKLAEGILSKYKLSCLFDNVIGSSTKDNGFIVERHPYGKAKVKLLPTACEIGIGNEYNDRFFLQYCQTAYVVNPDPKLLKLAIAHNWNII